ncbi:hypothetical protein QCA50_012468 [Cerrena zonata]|uniref:Uncharacterized protein n=1 Tax=Cerrena zonata TaxID=2478898 RepID=A0AAW0FUI2_9APHY
MEGFNLFAELYSFLSLPLELFTVMILLARLNPKQLPASSDTERVCVSTHSIFTGCLKLYGPGDMENSDSTASIVGPDSQISVSTRRSSHPTKTQNPHNMIHTHTVVVGDIHHHRNYES